MLYSIFHPKDGMNLDCVPKMEYKLVAQIEASSLSDAFKKSQNFNEEYAKLNIRSTSIGDIIMSLEDKLKKVCHLVEGIGFKEVPNSWVASDWLEEISTEGFREEFMKIEQKYMNEFISTHGEEAFIACVFHGGFQEFAFDFIHPEDELRQVENFEIIQKAFLNAYV